MSFIKVKVSKTRVAGVVGLTAAGIAATIVLATDTAADPSESRAVEEQQSAAVYNYTGPRSADAAERWLKGKTDQLEQQSATVYNYTGPRSADAAERWLKR